MLWNLKHAQAAERKSEMDKGSLFGHILAAVVIFLFLAPPLQAGTGALEAGVGKVDITNVEARPVNDRLYAKALVLKSGGTVVAIITVDAVAIGEIGYIFFGQNFYIQFA